MRDRLNSKGRSAEGGVKMIVRSKLRAQRRECEQGGSGGEVRRLIITGIGDLLDEYIAK